MLLPALGAWSKNTVTLWTENKVQPTKSKQTNREFDYRAPLIASTNTISGRAD